MCKNCEAIFAQGQSLYIHGPTSIIDQFHTLLNTRVSSFLHVLPCSSLNELASKKEFNISFKHIRNLYKKYTLQQLANHPAIVLYPYAVMSYSIIDYYIAKIPIFVPSSKLWKGVGDRSIRASYYCGNVQDIEPSINTIHPYSPNEEEDEAYQYWLKYADCKFIFYFYSIKF